MRFSEKKICIVTVAFEDLLCTTPLQEKGDRLEGAYDQQVLSESILAFFLTYEFLYYYHGLAAATILLQLLLLTFVTNKITRLQHRTLLTIPKHLNITDLVQMKWNSKMVAITISENVLLLVDVYFRYFVLTDIFQIVLES